MRANRSNRGRGVTWLTFQAGPFERRIGNSPLMPKAMEGSMKMMSWSRYRYRMRSLLRAARRYRDAGVHKSLALSRDRRPDRYPMLSLDTPETGARCGPMSEART
jgi:hypothetical protein